MSLSAPCRRWARHSHWAASVPHRVSQVSFECSPASLFHSLLLFLCCPKASFSLSSPRLPVLSQLLTDTLMRLLSPRQLVRPWGSRGAQDFGLGDFMSAGTYLSRFPKTFYISRGDDTFPQGINLEVEISDSERRCAKGKATSRCSLTHAAESPLPLLHERWPAQADLQMHRRNVEVLGLK